MIEDSLLLLRDMIAVPSFSREETAVADLVEKRLASFGIQTKRFRNNIVALPTDFNPGLPVVMLNSHIDTVKPSPAYTFDPFGGFRENGVIRGLGSNDAGASVVSLIAAFREMRDSTSGYNLILALSAEEEVGGENGMRYLLPALKDIGIYPAMAIVGEPTGMRPAIAERGLIVLDCLTRGVAGHAARNEGVNALYRAIEDIERVRTFKFPKVSEVLGDIKVSVTQINAGRQHNVVPDECRWVVDVRTTDAYSNEETADMLRAAVSNHTEANPRSTRVRASVIDSAHPLVKAAESLGLLSFVSPTTSDMSLMHDFPSLKIGPGESSRSHTADEFILESEITDAVEKYVKILKLLDTIPISNI